MTRTRRKFRKNRLIAKDNLKYLIIVLICVIAISIVLFIIRAEYAKRVAQKRNKNDKKL